MEKIKILLLNTRFPPAISQKEIIEITAEPKIKIRFVLIPPFPVNCAYFLEKNDELVLIKDEATRSKYSIFTGYTSKHHNYMTEKCCVSRKFLTSIGQILIYRVLGKTIFPGRLIHIHFKNSVVATK